MYTFLKMGDIWVILDISSNGKLYCSYISLPANQCGTLREDFRSNDRFLGAKLDDSWGFSDTIEINFEQVVTRDAGNESITKTLKTAINFLEERCSG